jgi:hypothetical protein
MNEIERQFASHEEVYVTRGLAKQGLGFKTIFKRGIIRISYRVGVILDRQNSKLYSLFTLSI